MANRTTRAFFAYPGHPADLSSTINTAAKLVSSTPNAPELKTWPQMDVFGANIPDEIRESIAIADVVICDVTRPNLNVYYEVGFAIGCGKAISPVVNSSFASATADLQRDGLFDNIGYKVYENSQELAALISDLPVSSLSELYSRPINYQQPLFFMDSFRKTDFRNTIVSSIKSSKTFYRSFDPVEVPRFSSVNIIADASASSGIIIPFLARHVDDSERHNLRASFLAGLSHGLKRETLLLRKENQDEIQPTDYRDLIVSVRNEDEISDLVAEFARRAQVASQSINRVKGKAKSKTALQRLTLGSSAAENEFRTLEEYFVETAEFLRTLRGEINVVAGRKGSGKTAIFFQVRDTFRKDKQTLITDLKPESHQLSMFRKQLLSIVDSGVFDHTLAAFWYFVILSEVLATLKKDAEHRSKFDDSALSVVHEIGEMLTQMGVASSGDFTSRINRLGAHLIQDIEQAKAENRTLSAGQLTNIVFKVGISKVRELILKHTSNRNQLVLLFDNVDKGWPTNGVHPFDVRLVRLLIEALDKIRRDFNAADRDFMSVVFLRNDIYELLVEDTPDRGKAGEVRIDWTDRAKLRQVIYKRIQASTKEKSATFEEIWGKLFIQNVEGKGSFEYFLDHCLMRPRFLINILENAVANAINRGHDVVSEEDSVDAVRQHSLYLVEDFGYEIRDVSGYTADILYSLVGVDRIVEKKEVLEKFLEVGMEPDHLEDAFHLMMWYGVIGILGADEHEKFIYDYEYNIRRLDAEVRNLKESARFAVNPALHVALNS